MSEKHYDGGPVGHPYLILECCLKSGSSSAELAVVASIAGRETVSVRRWKLPQGLPTEPQGRDLAHYVANLVSESTVAFCGVQREMLLG